MSSSENTRRLAAIAARAAGEKLATDIAVYDVADLMAISEIFVVATGDNERQVRAIVDEIEDELTAAGLEPLRREGNREFRWVLLDYGNFVVHVQRAPEREFYALDSLYYDCELIEVEGVEPFIRPGNYGDEVNIREVENIDEIPLAAEGPLEDSAYRW